MTLSTENLTENSLKMFCCMKIYATFRITALQILPLTLHCILPKSQLIISNAQGGHSAHTHTGSFRENFRQPINISSPSLQPKINSSFYTLTPENGHKISGSNANRGHKCP